MVRYLLSIFIFIVSLSISFAQPGKGSADLNFSGEEVESLPWNTANGLIQKSSIEGSYGSTSFTVVGDGKISFLNELKNEITAYKKHKIVLQFKTEISPVLGFSFIGDKYYVYGIRECAVHDSNGVLVSIIKLPAEIKSIRNVIEIDGNVFFVSINQISYLYSNNEFIKYEGIPLEKGLFVKAIKLSENHVELKLIESGSYVRSYDFKTSQRLSSLKIIGGSKSKMFLDVEFIKQEKPLIAEREIFAVNLNESNIKELDSIVLPNSYFVSVRRDLEFYDNSIYYFLTTPNSGSIYKLQLNYSSKNSVFDAKALSSSFHYNNNFKEEISIPYGKKLGKDSVVAPISREQIIARAEAFETHTWTATVDNIWSGQICDNQQVISAPYVKVGENTSVPYMWDGFSSIEKFDEGMSNGLAAGNSNTSTKIGSMNCAEGVDCSGYVSQAWNTIWKYDTREFYPIVIEYDSWSDLKPGDIANKPGHVRLFHSWNSNGTMNMLEATSRDNVWRVVYNTYTISEMQSRYTPGYLYSVYDEAASVKNNDAFNNSIKISPNPVINSFRIDVESDELYSELTFKIINTRGEVLIKGNVDEKLIDLCQFETGIYFVKVSSNKYTVVKKIIKK